MRISNVQMVVIGLAILSLCWFVSPAVLYEFEIEIDISPKVLNIESQGTVVTLHTDINYYAVDVYSIYLNGIAIRSWKADNRGNFVAKFFMEEVKTLDGLVIGDYNNFQLVGITVDKEPFFGEQQIKGINVIPQGH